MPVRVLVCVGKDAVLCSGYKHRLWNYTAWVHVQILLCHVLAVWLWLSYLTSLCLSVLMCRVGIVIAPTNRVAVRTGG